MLFGVLALWAQVRIFRGGGRLAWVLYALASVAMVWTQYFGAFQVVVQQLAFAFACYSRLRRGEPVRQLVVPWVISSLAIAACLAPLLPFAYQQYVVNQTGGKGFGGPQQVGSATSLSGNHLSIYAALAVLIWGIWGYQPTPVMMLVAALWPLGMLFALVMLGRRHQRATTLLLLVVLGPGVALFALGLVKRDLFDIRYLSTIVPVLFVLLARGLTAIPRRTLALVGATTLVLVSLAAGLIDQQYNGANPRTYDFNGALASIEAEARPGDVVYYDPVDLNQVVGLLRAASRPQTSVGPAPTPGQSSDVHCRQPLAHERREQPGCPLELLGRSAQPGTPGVPPKLSERRDMGVPMTVRTLEPHPVEPDDPRLEPPDWRGPAEWRSVQRRLRLLVPLNIALAVWYFEWLLRPGRVGNPVLYGLLIAAELFNLVQAVGFWWTTLHGRDRGPAPQWSGPPTGRCPDTGVQRTARRGRAERLCRRGLRGPTSGSTCSMTPGATTSPSWRGGPGRRTRGGRATTEPRRAISTMRCAGPTRPSWWSSTVTTYRIHASWSTPWASWPRTTSPMSRRPSTTPMRAAARWPPPPGRNRPSSSVASLAARTASTPCSAAAPTSCSGAPRWRARAAFPSRH